MSHLPETLLNEYLDERLAPADRQATELHLKECAGCRSRLEELRSVFQFLGEAPERTLKHDLAPAVLARLQVRRLPVFLRIVLAVQAGLGIGMLALMVRLGWTLFQPKGHAPFSLPNLFSLADQFAFHPVIELQSLKLPGLPLPAPTLIIILIVSILLLGMGNAKLLKNGSRI